MKLLQALLGYGRPETVGERLYLRCFELFVCGWAILFAWQWAGYLPRLGGVISPAGVGHWIDLSVLFEPVLARTNAALITLCCIVGMLHVFRPAYAIAIVAMHVQFAARYSQGKIPHGATLIGVGLLGLALGALLERRPLWAQRFALGFTVLFTAIGYTSAALCKLGASGPGWIAGEHLVLWIHERLVDAGGKYGEGSLNSVQVMLLDHPPLATLSLTFGLVMEAIALLAILPRFRPWVFGLLILMHVGIWISMDILFDVNVYFLILLAFPWGTWLHGAASAVLGRFGGAGGSSEELQPSSASD